MWNIKDIAFKLESCCYDEFSESGMPEGLSEFLIGKVITYLKHDLDIFKSGRNTKKFLKIISIDYKSIFYDKSKRWIIKAQPCSKNGLVNTKSNEKDYNLNFLIKNVVSGKITIIESKADGNFEYKEDDRLTSLKRKLNGQKLKYQSLSDRLRRSGRIIKELEKEIEKYKDDI